MMARVDIMTFQQHLQTHGARYFPDFPSQSVTVTPLGQHARPSSTLYRYNLQAGDREQAILVKVPSSRQNQEARAGVTLPDLTRPRLTPNLAGAEKYQLEFSALAAIEAHFRALNDPRFGYIRVLALLPETQAIVMTEASEPPLRELVRPGPALGRDLTPGFRHAGAWLAAYHQMLLPEHAVPRHLNRLEYVETIWAFTQFLGEKSGDPSFFAAVAREVIAQAEAGLPTMLPAGLMHGDYGLRNILLRADDRITVIDTLARWCAPIYEDIAYFLVGLRSNRLQVFSQGLAFREWRLAAYETAFLAGYFGDAIPPRSLIYLFEIQTLLDKWSSLFTLIQTGRRGAFKEMQLAMINRFYRRCMRRLLASLAEAA